MNTRATQVAALLKGISETLPGFLDDARRFAVPFLDAATPLLRLDCRRGGRKWQEISPEAVPAMLETALRLFAEWHSQFLGRADFQAALKQQNAGVKQENRKIKKANEAVVDAHFSRRRAEVERWETVPGASREICAPILVALDLIADIHARERQPFPEKDTAIIKRWCRVEFVRGAMAEDSAIRERVRQELRKQPRPAIDDLVGHALVGLMRHCVEHDHESARKTPQLLHIVSSADGLQLAMMLVNGIQSTLKGQSHLLSGTSEPITIETLTRNRSHFMILDADFSQLAAGSDAGVAS